MNIGNMNTFGLITLLLAGCAASSCLSAASYSNELDNGIGLIDEEVQPVKKGDPPTRGDRDQQRIKDHLANAGTRWVQAMEALEDPYLLISFGIEGGSAERSLGLNLRNDELSMTRGLASQLGAYMGDAYIDTQIIDIDTMLSTQKDIAAEMGNAGHESIMDRVMNELDVDLAIVCQFTQLPDNKFRITPKVVEPSSGRRFDVGSFTIDPLNRSNRLITAAIFEELAAKVQQMTKRKSPKFNIRIVGDIGDIRPGDLGKLISDLEYVENEKPVTVRKKSNYHKVSSVRYGGSALDLGYDVKDILEEEYGMRSEVLYSEGEVAIQVYKNVGAPAWYLLTGEKQNDKRDMFEALYSERGSPRVAVVTIGNPEYSVSIEDHVAGMMMNAGVDVVDAGQVRSQVGPSGLNGGDEQLLERLRDLGGFDVLVLGHGKVGSSMSYHTTYRAIEVGTGRLLGTSSWPSQEASEDPDYGVDPESPDARDVARYLSGSILDMFMRNHLVKGSSIDIRVDGVSSLRQAGFIASSIESAVSGVSSISNVRLSGNVANFTLRYSGDVNRLVASMQESISSLPIETKIDSAGPGSLRIRAKQIESDG